MSRPQLFCDLCAETHGLAIPRSPYFTQHDQGIPTQWQYSPLVFDAATAAKAMPYVFLLSNIERIGSLSRGGEPKETSHTAALHRRPPQHNMYTSFWH